MFNFKKNTDMETMLYGLKDQDFIKEITVNEQLYNFNYSRKYLAFEILDSIISVQDAFNDIKRNAIPRIINEKYLITSIEIDRDILKACWVIAFMLIDVCSIIRRGEKLSEDTLEKARYYVMETDDAELLFKYKQALESYNV